MYTNCKWLHVLLGIAVIVFAFWETVASQWVLLGAGALIVFHALWHKTCCDNCTPGKSKTTPLKKDSRGK